MISLFDLYLERLERLIKYLTDPSQFIINHQNIFVSMESYFDITVVGLGINGLCTAYHLSKNPDLKILLLEQFDVGHDNGSSHSQIRIIRSAYKDPLYVELTLEARKKYWPQLQNTLKCKLVNNNPFIIFGEHESVFQQYKNSIGKKGFENLRIISGKQAQERFPELKLDHYKQIIQDTEAGVIQAFKTNSSIYAYLKTLPNVTIKTYTKLINYVSNHGIVNLDVQGNNSSQKIQTKKLLLTAGKWVKQLIPTFSEHFSINEQFISYLQFDGPHQNYCIGKLPTWMSFDHQKQFYCLPAFGSDWVKFGRHINLMTTYEPTEEQRIKQMQEFASKTFMRPIKKIQKTQKCYYTSTVEEDFVIDYVDENKNVLVASVCSGHAFKFGPVTGLILSELIQTGKSSINIFQQKMHQFSFQYEKSLRQKHNKKHD